MKAVGICALWIGAIIFGGFVFQQLWLWFVVPLGMSAINIAHAIGLRFFFAWNVLKQRDLDAAKGGKGETGYLLTAAYVTSAMALLLGWAVSLWVTP